MSFHLDNVISSHRLLSEHITASAIATNQTWPFVTIPHFEVEASYCRQTSGAEILAFAPLIGANDIEAWGPYSVENQGWLQESRDIIQNSGRAGTLTLSSYLEGNVTPMIFEAADEYFTVVIPAVNPPLGPVWYVFLPLEAYSSSFSMCASFNPSCFHHQPTCFLYFKMLGSLQASISASVSSCHHQLECTYAL
jgi:hypothetical protein